MLAERVGQGEVGGCHPPGDSAWQLLHLAVEKPSSNPRVGHFLAVAAGYGKALVSTVMDRPRHTISQ